MSEQQDREAYIEQQRLDAEMLYQCKAFMSAQPCGTCLACAERSEANLRAELAALKGQTCETCKFGRMQPINTNPDLHQCYLPGAYVEGKRYPFVPFTINGQPFGCRGHQPKEAAK